MPAEGLAQAKSLSLGEVSGTWELQVISEQKWDWRSRVESRNYAGCRGSWAGKTRVLMLLLRQQINSGLGLPSEQQWCPASHLPLSPGIM